MRNTAHFIFNTVHCHVQIAGQETLQKRTETLHPVKALDQDIAIKYCICGPSEVLSMLVSQQHVLIWATAIPRKNFDKIAQGTHLARTWKEQTKFIQTYFLIDGPVMIIKQNCLFFPFCFFVLNLEPGTVRSRRLQVFNGQVDYAWMEKVAVDASSRRNQGTSCFKVRSQTSSNMKNGSILAVYYCLPQWNFDVETTSDNFFEFIWFTAEDQVPSGPQPLQGVFWSRELRSFVAGAFRHWLQFQVKASLSSFYKAEDVEHMWNTCWTCWTFDMVWIDLMFFSSTSIVCFEFRGNSCPNGPNDS